MTHWLSNLWFNYFWASLKGNGPEAIVQTVVYGLIALVVVPPFRRWVGDHMRSLHSKLDAHHEALLSQAEGHHEQHLDLVREHHAVVLSTLKPPPVEKPAPVKAQPVKKTVAKKAVAKKGTA